MPRKKKQETSASFPYNHSHGKPVQLSLFSPSSDASIEVSAKDSSIGNKPPKKPPGRPPAVESEAIAPTGKREKRDCALCSHAVICEGETYKCSAGVFGGQIRLRLNWGMSAGCDRFHNWQVPEPFIEATVLTPPSHKGDRTKGKVINTLTAPNGSEAVTIEWENGRTMTYTLQQCEEYGYQVDMDGTEADIWGELFPQGGDRHE